MKAVILLFCSLSVAGLAEDVRVDREKERPEKLNSGEPMTRSNRPLIGAIRWDGWRNNCEIGKDSERVLGPAKYHHRAPFFVAAAGPGQSEQQRKGPEFRRLGIRFFG